MDRSGALQSSRVVSALNLEASLPKLDERAQQVRGGMSQGSPGEGQLRETERDRETEIETDREGERYRQIETERQR